MKRAARWSWALTGALWAVAGAARADAVRPVCSGQEQAIGASFFGMHVRYSELGHWPRVPFATWRIIQYGSDWRGIQPRRDHFTFDFLDAAVERALRHGVEPLLVLGQTPAWAAARPQDPHGNGQGASSEPVDLGDWERYVRAVVRRYKGRIRYYEVWNEPRFESPSGERPRTGFFNGPVRSMAAMARITKAVVGELDPAARVISPSFDGVPGGPKRFEEFLAAGGAQGTDIIGFHFYGLPEHVEPAVQALRAVATRYGLHDAPIWNTETGVLVWDDEKKPQPRPEIGPPFHVVYSPAGGVGEALKNAVVSAACGVQRQYWFSWDIPSMALSARRGAVDTPAGAAYTRMHRWTCGTVVQQCLLGGGTGQCVLRRADGQRAVLAWAQGRAVDRTAIQLGLPGARQVEMLDRPDVQTVATDRPLRLNAAPILVSEVHEPWRGTCP